MVLQVIPGVPLGPQDLVGLQELEVARVVQPELLVLLARPGLLAIPAARLAQLDQLVL